MSEPLTDERAGGAAGAAQGHRFVFVGGLHRSGTSMLARHIAAHPDVSGFSGTGVPQDEGAHLQSVYPDPANYGKTGRFGFQPEARLTERSPLVSDESRERLFAEWARHWDLSRPVLLEKSPPNLVKLRFLQAVFPDSSFVVIMRHPIPVSCATQKWNRMKPHQLVRHWLRCHDLLARDVPHLRRLHVVRYEDLVAHPEPVLERLFGFLRLDGAALPPPPQPVRGGINDHYFGRWELRKRHPAKRVYLALVENGYEHHLPRFGYSLREPERLREPSVVLPGLTRPRSGGAS